MEVKNNVNAMIIIAVICITLMTGDASAIDGCVKLGGDPNNAADVFTCGETVTESCIFNADLTSCPAGSWGLEVGASDITIDGTSHKITGSRSNAACNVDLGYGNPPTETTPAKHSGIVNKGNYDNVVIKDLEIEGFCTGIVLGFAGSIDVDNNDVLGCNIHNCGDDGRTTHGIHMVYTNNCTVRKNNISAIDGSCGGCSAGGNGIFMYGTSDGGATRGYYNEFACNNFFDNDKSGFFMKHQCMYNTIGNNYAEGNGEGGIVLMCIQSNYNIIEGNAVSENTQGVFIGGKNNTIRYNTVTNNNECGISMGRSDGSYNNEVYENTVCNNGDADIESCASGNHGHNNTCDTTSDYDDDGTTGCTYDCSPAPDLVITEKSDEWVDLADKTYNSTYTVKNIGDTDAGKSNTSIRIDGVEVAIDPVPQLAPDGVYTATVGTFTMSDGSDAIKICADRDYAVSEKSKEYNNCLEDIFRHPGMPDLVITNKSEEWTLEGSNYSITYTVTNIGGAEAGASNTSIRIDGVEVKTDPVGILAAGASHTSTIGPFTMSDGSDTITVCADNGSSVDESNEANNCFENIFSLKTPPDLVITKKFEKWVVGDTTYNTYTITYIITNTGDKDANASNTSIRIDGIEVAIDPVPVLKGGGSHTNTVGPFTMSGENDAIMVCADNESAVDESDETNNCVENVFEYTAFGCVASDGTLFRCGDTVTTSCTFNERMTCPIGSGGLIIGEDGIVIDGDGYTITGTAIPANCEWAGESTPCLVSGIYNEGHDDVVIKNLEIEGFCTGIALAGICNITIDDCRIHDNGFNTTGPSGGEMVTHGIHACRIAGSYDEPALVITNNKIYNNEGTGGGCGDGGNGIFIYAGGMGDMHEYCDISHNNIYGNAKAGFWTKMQLSGSTIAHNEIWGNGNGAGITDDVRGGIVLRCKKSSDNTIAHNNVSNNAGSGNSGYGIFVGGRGNLVSDNRANENTGDGIRMGRSDSSSDNRIEGNTVCENDRYGVYAAGGTKNNTLHNNVIHDNGQKDIYDQAGGLAGDENTCNTAYQYHDQTAGNPPPCTYQGPGYGPDLEVTELTPSWTVSGVNYTIDYQVCNSGRGVLANAGETGVYINDALVTSDSVPELGPGQCHSETLGPFPITTGSGIDAIRLCADYTGNETRDHEKANNNLTDVFGGPDLVITEFRHEWIDQARYNLGYTVENIGDLPTPADCWTNFTELHCDWQGRVDHAPIQAGLDVGESVTHTVGPCSMEGDSDWLEAWVNFNHTFDENVEDDLHGNRARFTLASQPPQPSEKGDINGDGEVTPADAAIVLRMAVSGECSEEADVSGDHKVTSLDALMILQWAAA